MLLVFTPLHNFLPALHTVVFGSGLKTGIVHEGRYRRDMDILECIADLDIYKIGQQLLQEALRRSSFNICQKGPLLRVKIGLYLFQL